MAKLHGVGSTVEDPEHQAVDFQLYSECSREPPTVFEPASDGVRPCFRERILWAQFRAKDRRHPGVMRA